ncbi:MAG: peptide ABC transporter substrate-binding protein [Flexilinea flocculi]|nr:peptide ABC transporter substrate-binding protein [Flexilinea flocculi]
MKRNRIVLLISILMTMLLIASPAMAEGENIFRTSFNSGDIPSIDQALVTDFIGIQIADETTVGLLRQNEENGELEPGMAVEWTASDDKLVYTFKLLEGIPWVKYNPDTDAVEEVKDCTGNTRFVTAKDFVYGVERTLRPETASGYAFLVNQSIVGAADYNAGTTTDFSTVGVKALDDYTLEINFIEDGVFNLNIVSMWMMHAMPSWLIDGDDCNEGVAERWTESGIYEGYGPFTLKEWVHDSELTLIANPFWPGTDAVPQPKLSAIHYDLIGDVMALSEYEAGNMDYAVIPSGDYDRITTDPAYTDHLIYRPTSIGTEWLIYNPWLAPTDDIRVRQALSYAVDKDAVVKAVKAGETAPYFINPAVAGAPKKEDYPDLGIMYDPVKAKALIDEYCAEKGIKPADVKVIYSYSTSDANKLRAEAVQSMWQTNLGITVELQNSEWAVFKVERREGLANVYRSSWVQDYMDANNFTADVFLCPGGAYQPVTDWPSVGCKDVSDPVYVKYAEIIKAAGKETDTAKRAELYAQSEDILLKEVAIINPLNWNNSYVLMNPRITAPVSITGYERWEKWEVK